MKVFAGPADVGIYSPSVQNTLHITEKLILDNIPEVCIHQLLIGIISGLKGYFNARFNAVSIFNDSEGFFDVEDLDDVF